VVRESWLWWQTCDPIKVANQFLGGIFHVKKVSLHELEQISVVETSWHIDTLILL
jgi:hypothetical protein